ncbi:MAG: SsrA-binding protein SmpB [Promicromonosporaceae bacterium]|nr:SsrA-binding protein SmpB [Promicromonosporaceae bacterium]
MAKGAPKQVPEAWRTQSKPKVAAPTLQVVANNKKARHDYVIEDVFEAGIVLTGTEVKALRMGRASLTEAFVLIDPSGEAWLERANIPAYFNGTWTNHAPLRKRKLLLHKAEIIRLGHKVQAKGHTIIPLRLYFLDGRAKVEIALARGKKEYDKRHTLREQQDNREAQRAMRHRTMLG